jgi:hypothetical protein
MKAIGQNKLWKKILNKSAASSGNNLSGFKTKFLNITVPYSQWSKGQL